MLALVLIKKIFSLFLIMLMGFLVVRSGKLKAEDSRILSMLTAYLIVPCVIITSFQLECTKEVLNGLLMAVIASVILNFGLIVSAHFCAGPLRLSREEHLSIIYPNTGTLVIPLVIAMLGSEYVIYTSPFVSVQTFLLWSHGKSVMCGETKADLKKVFSNINIIAIIIGALMFAFGLRLPPLVLDAMDDVSAMVGPTVMLVTGMLVGGMDYKKIFRYKRLPFVIVCRLLIVPVIFILIFKLIGIERLAENSEAIMLIAILSVSTPAANTVTQFAQLFGGDADYANVINLATTVLCIITIPAIIALYQLI